MKLPCRFGKYELLDRIATGGMAEVFLARSFGVEGFEKRLVIKRILPDLARNPRFVSMFIREAKISAGLSHPNIVQVFDFGKVGPDHYIAMEHMYGRDLTRLNKRLRADGRRMPIELACYITASLFRGLGYAHARRGPDGTRLNLVHRDVSPHNVMVSFQGEIKLFDFGIARLIGHTEEGKQTKMPGGGKYAYMSPEQAGGEAIDHRSDIYSAGIVLYELLVGHRLFQDPDPKEKLRKVRMAIVPDPRVEVPEIPDELWEILQKLLALDIGDRYPSAELAEEDLRAFMYRQGFRVHASTMGQYLSEEFSEDAEVDPGVVDLEGLAADLTRLDGEAPTQATEDSMSTHTVGTPTTNYVMPGLLRMAPGEKKPVVVLVAEACGFTGLSLEADPEDVVRRHVTFLRRFREVVDRYGGFLERFQDDTCVVFFGVPRAGEHDLDRALACAKELVRTTRKLRRRGLDLDLSVGINMGEITVGRQSGRNFRYLAAGDTVKLALRLSMEADLGQVLASERVAEVAGGAWHFDGGPGFRMKGRDGERAAFVLQGRTRRLSGPGGRWLRRGQEIEVLRTALGGLGQGRGAVIAIEGDIGTGKSRLLRELSDLSTGRGVPLFVGRAPPYGERPLTPLREIVAGVLGINPDSQTSEVRAALANLTILSLSDNDVQVLGSLFGLEPASPISRDAVVQAMTRLIRGLVEVKPIIVAIEDTEHLGTVEQQLVGHLIRNLRASPVLILLTARGTLSPHLGAPDESVFLSRLSKTDQRAMLADFLGVKRVSRELSELVFRTAEGNPLYMEAVVKALQSDDRIQIADDKAELRDPERDAGLPPGLEALIAARIDALDPASKGALQIAAVVGQSFTLALLGEAAGLDDPGVLVDTLVEAGLIVPEGSDDARYSFVSQLVVEVVRRSILGVQRRDYHRMVAAGIERLYSDNLEPYRVALAEHCAAAGRPLDAARHASRAGDLLRRQHFLERAAQVWDRGVEWIRKAQDIGAEPDACTLGEALLRLKGGEVWALLGNPKRATRHLQIALDIAEEIDDAEIESRALLGLGRLYVAAGKLSLARMHLEAASNTAQDHGWGREVAVQALEALGMLAYDAGDVAESDRHFEEALQLAGDDDALAARALLGLAGRHIRVGDELDAMELLQRAQTKAEAASDRILLGRVVNNIGIVHLHAGRLPDALEQFRRAVEIREGLGYRVGVIINLHNIGDTHLRMGDDARAWAAFEKSRDLAREANWERGVVMNEAFLAYLEGKRTGDSSDAEERLEAALQRAEELSDAETQVTAGWLLGLHLVALDRSDEAMQSLEGALSLAQRIEDRAMIAALQRALDDLGPDNAAVDPVDRPGIPG